MQTQAQQFAAVYAANLAKRQLFTIRAVSLVTKLITAGVGIVSYRHQMGTLLDWHAPAEIAYVVPALVDLLTIACVLAISTPGLIAKARTVASRVIVFPILVSAAINFAGHGSIGVKLVCLSLPIFIPLGEIVGAVIKPDFAEMDRIERAAYAVAAPAAKPVDEEARARRSEAALKAAETRRQNKAEADAKAEQKRADRRQRAAVKSAAPVSPAPAGPMAPSIHVPSPAEIAALVA